MDQDKPSILQIQQLQEDLEFLEGYIEEFFEFLPLPVCIVNPLNIILGVNQSFQDLTGYNAIEVGGRDATELFLEKSDIDFFVNESVQVNKRVVKELTLATKDKKTVPVNVYGLARRDDEGNFIGYFLAISDISNIKQFQEGLEDKVREKTRDLEESKRALVNILEDVDEARVRAEEERNKTLAVITNFTDGLIIFDKKGKVTLINPRAELLLGVEGGRLAETSMARVKNMPEFAPLTELINSKAKGIHRAEIIIREDLILDITKAPIIREKEDIGTLIVLHDVTREKMVERMKTEFVSLAAHQLRTPLSAIKWSLKMLLDGDVGKITQDQKDFVDKTYSANERLIALINDLLNVTKIEEGRYLSNLALNDVDQVIRSVIDNYKDTITKKGIKVEFDQPKGKLPKAKIDAEKIQLSFQNLFDNAIRYTGKDGKITVGIKLLKQENSIEVSVKDTGIGIPKDQQARVFSKFFRAENAMKKDTEGTGLGLFIAKNIVASHGGKIWFESEEGKGSTFFFTVPLG